MARTKKIAKKIEPVKVWVRQLKNGNKGIYLRMYVPNSSSKGYKYENLKMYLIPEVDAYSKAQNRNTLMAVEAIKAQRILDITNGKAGIKKADRSEKVLLVDWMGRYSAMKRKAGQSESNSNTINSVMLHLVKYKGAKVTMAQVDVSFCKGFINYLANATSIGTDTPKKRGEHKQKPLANSTARLYFNTFVTALNEAVRGGIIDVNPTAKLGKEDKKPVKKIANKRGYLEVEEVKRLIETPCSNKEVRDSFLFACFCGLRLSDVCDLKWRDIKSLAGGKKAVSRVQIKTREEVTIPLSGRALEFLPDRGKADDDDSVFALPCYTSLNLIVQKWAKDAGVEKHVTFHLSRHSFATTLLTAGTDLYTVSKMLGHQNIKTTQIYAEVVSRKKEEAVSKIDSLFE